ncbi:MAG: trypsin-like peptidase domain-containing protein, partial [Gemmatimonadota bacterium]|nr:trypsin-like peptidase domain-containing protein [Gemmatimonadota bacterium]
VEGADRIVVVLQDNRRLDARLIGNDPTTDVAVIKVDGSGFAAARIGRSEMSQIGEWVLAIGNPLALGTTVTSGIISAKGRNLGIIGETMGERSQSQWAIEDFIQTDAAINPGNSGGPLVNLRGEVIGINSVIASRTGFYSGYGFAIPIDLGRRIADDLIRYGRVRRAALGVSVRDVTPEDAEVYRLPRIEGVLLNDFEAGSPARAAGLRQGDVIVAVDGQKVGHVGELQRRIAIHRPGEEVTLSVIREGRQQTARIRLMEAQTTATATAAAPARGPQGAPAVEPASSTKLGVQVAPLTPELAQRYQFSRPGGVIITGVQPYGVLWRRGLTAPGLRIVSVDGAAVENVAQFQRVMAAKQPREVVSLVLETPNGRQNLVNLRLPE